MKNEKTKFILTVVLLGFAFPTGVLAVGNQVQNQNQVQVQNQGEVTQLNTATQEQERSEFGPADGSNATTQATKTQTRASWDDSAPAYMNQVYQKMQQLATGSASMRGVGPQVQKMAQEQAQAQEEIQSQLKKLDSRSGLVKKLFGQNRGAVEGLRQQIEQNRVRIRQMQEVKNQVYNQADQVQLQEAIQLMENQNTSLQNRLSLEEGEVGLFGWFFNLFN